MPIEKSRYTFTIENLSDFFDNHAIEYWTSGKNVSEGAINIQCIFCDDHSNHLGLFPEDGKFNCWRCGTRGIIPNLLKKLALVSNKELEWYFGGQRHSSLSAVEEINSITKKGKEEETEESTTIDVPKEAIKISESTRYKPLLNYLKRRRYSLQDCIRYNCYFSIIGKYAGRLIIPIYENGEVVSFQAVSLNPDSRSVKYLSAGNDIKSFLYGEPDETIVLVEGVFDVWRYGKGALCSFGTHLTDNQIRKVRLLKPKRLIIAWDADAYWKARGLAKKFSLWFDNIDVVRFPDNHDPDSFGREYGVNRLREFILQE